MKDYLVCVDSDGCAMDTMTIKHVRCFGPQLVKEFGLGEWEEPILARWNEMNLYTKKRGMNRFQGLLLMLEEVDARYVKISGLEKLANWVNHTDAYSEASLQAAIEEAKGSGLLEKAFAWSRRVNEEIQNIPGEEKREFPGVRDAFEKIKAVADLAIVSSANREAMEEEWSRRGLLKYVDYAMAQDVGTKAACLRKMVEEGYEKSKIIMVGDAVGDYLAAREAGVAFYPILAGREAASWEHFSEQVLDEVVSGTYTSKRQKEEFDEFEHGLL